MLSRRTPRVVFAPGYPAIWTIGHHAQPFTGRGRRSCRGQPRDDSIWEQCSGPSAGAPVVNRTVDTVSRCHRCRFTGTYNLCGIGGCFSDLPTSVRMGADAGRHTALRRRQPPPLRSPGAHRTPKRGALRLQQAPECLHAMILLAKRREFLLLRSEYRLDALHGCREDREHRACGAAA